ncbi:hypothetical protein IF1G_10859 [Cordyceps javanica]|uniref:Hydroxyneurosporene synthase n=1 Tax=Cordyceps javanica TaxID=43265 RepID=A0A545VJN8_9HYPO|nr:hypothetical protein IF1G_10859 [Cordyceps javanica]TQW01909.1 hypothetical protein IF2G_10622 [Cordyceps javanica]
MPCGTMFKTLAYAALLSSFAAANLYQVPLSPSKFLVNDDFTPKWDDKSCTISRSTAYEVHEGPNTFSTSASDPINSIKISPVINKTNWEQWEFDGISHTGISLMMVMFSRDHSFYFFGKGNLRMEMFMTTPDGKHHTELQYLKESIILDCPDYTYGLWNSSDKSYSFYTTKDLKHTKLVFDSPGIRGTYKLTATTPPVHADGSAPDPDRGNAAEATELSPDLYYSVPVAGGEVEMDAVLPFGRKLAFKGRGGSARLWAKQGWLGLSASWVALRAWAGPYTITYWHVVSRVGAKRGIKFASGQLFYNDELLVGAHTANVSKTEDYVLDTYNTDGEVSGTYDDKNTGAVFEFVSATQDKKWRFETQHTMRWYELGVGEGLGMSDFADRVVGGEVNGPQYEGRGLTEQAKFPEYIPQWAIFLLYGVGFFGNGKDYVVDFFRFWLPSW